MINLSSHSIRNMILSGFLASLFSIAFFRCYVRINTTLIGYRIGQLKGSESELLEERSRLRMKLAKLTTKDSLLARTSIGKRSRYAKTQ